MIRFLLLIGILLKSILGFSQDATECEQIYIKAKKMFIDHEYQSAIRKIAAYKLCNPRQAKKADEFLLQIYETVNRQRIEAEFQKRAADSIAKIAVAETNAALANLLISEAKSLRNTDATLALNLAKESLKLKYNEKVYQTALDIYNGGTFYYKVASDSATEYKENDFDKGSYGVTTVSPDNQTILTGGDDGVLRAWDIHGHLLKRITMPAAYDSFNSVRLPPPSILAISYSRSGNYYATLDCNYQCIIWNRKHQLIKNFYVPLSLEEPVNAYYLLELYKVPYKLPKVKFTADDKWVLTQTMPDSLGIYHLFEDSFRTFAIINESDSSERYSSFLQSLEISPDGNSILTLHDDNTIRIFNLQGKRLLTVVDKGRELSIARFSRDGKKILAGTKNGEMLIYNLNGKLEKIFVAKLEKVLTINSRNFIPESSVFSIDQSTDRKLFLLGYGDARARLWDSSGNLIKEFLHPLKDFWRIEGTAKFYSMDAIVSFVRFSEDNLFVITATELKNAYTWDLIGLPYKEFKYFLPSPKNMSYFDSVYQNANCIYNLSASPDRKHILVGNDKNVFMLNSDSGNIQFCLPFISPIISTSISKQGTFFVETCESVYLYNSAGMQLKQYQSPPNQEISFSPDGETIVFKHRKEDENIILSSFGKTFDRCSTPEYRYPESTLIVRFPHRNSKIDMTSEYSLLMAKFIIGKEEREISRYFTANVTACEFIRNGRAVLIRTADGVARIWDDKGNVQLEINHVPEIMSIADLNDNNTLITGDYFGRVKFWQAPTMEEFITTGHLSPLTSKQKKMYNIR